MHIQERMEYEYSAQAIPKYLKKELVDAGFEPKVEAIVDMVEEYLDADHELTYMVAGGEIRTRHDLIEVIDTLRKTNLPKLVWKIVTSITAHQKPMTHQQIVGMCFKQFDAMSEPSRQLKAIDIVLIAVSQSCFVEVDITKGETIMWHPSIKLSEEGVQQIKQRGYILPSLTPLKKVTDNNSIGYRTIHESVFCGNSLKHHDMYVNLDHINRKNAIAYSFEPRLYKLVDPRFDNSPKLTKRGTYETPQETQERKESWMNLHTELPKKAAMMVKYGNKFYIPHRYDMRLRSYAKAKHFNYLGTKFLKAGVMLNQQEHIVGEW